MKEKICIHIQPHRRESTETTRVPLSRLPNSLHSLRPNNPVHQQSTTKKKTLQPSRSTLTTPLTSPKSIKATNLARLAQSVERETLNLKVVGSTPTSGSIPVGEFVQMKYKTLMFCHFHSDGLMWVYLPFFCHFLQKLGKTLRA
ncbi:hypothetical protein B0H63DRAFT_180997 [Podospora didyma]|uniref:Uncharacterized protein n=1 Tax=Podospora didyma TaxID=330526 RepID=A0AAE0NPE9_9PEZI|nr:hypothetical protein B0H63DRAFT_180997 [Podospora didyma]